MFLRGIADGPPGCPTPISSRRRHTNESLTPSSSKSSIARTAHACWVEVSRNIARNPRGKGKQVVRNSIRNWLHQLLHSDRARAKNACPLPPIKTSDLPNAHAFSPGPRFSAAPTSSQRMGSPSLDPPCEKRGDKNQRSPSCEKREGAKYAMQFANRDSGIIIHELEYTNQIAPIAPPPSARLSRRTRTPAPRGGDRLPPRVLALG